MTEDDILRAYELSAKKVAEVSLREKRYLYSHLDWDDRLISLRGPRGTGKTTMLLQKIRESGKEKAKTLYVSLDSIWLNATTPTSITTRFVRRSRSIRSRTKSCSEH